MFTLSKIILKGYIVVADVDLSKVKTELVNHTALTLQEKGCLVFEVKQDELNNNKFFVYEEFIDQQSFDTHQRRVNASTWGAMSKNVKRHYDISYAK